MIKRLTQREQLFAALVVILGLVLFIYYSFVRPLKEQIRLLEIKVKDSEKQISKNFKLIRKGEAREKEYKIYLQEFKQDKPNEQVMSSILAEIEAVALELQLQISDLKPKRVKEGGDYNQFSVSLAIDSSLENIIHFLHILQSEPHIFDVEGLEFEKGSQRKSDTMKTRLVLSKILIP